MESNSNNDDLYSIVLFLISLSHGKEIECQWGEFSKSIKKESRFFTKSPILEKIESVSNTAKRIIEKNSMILYRARIFQNEQEWGQQAVVQLKNLIIELYPNLHFSDEDLLSQSGLLQLQADMLCERQKWDLLIEKMETKISTLGPFYGYDEKSSDAPPAYAATAGRANSQGISVLYASSDVNTAISEMRPMPHQTISVASIKVKKDLKLFDFTTNLCDDKVSQSFDLMYISQMFSRPNYGKQDEYFPTQYICELIRHMGFDGICFSSAMNPDGMNYVIFDTGRNASGFHENYEIIGSKVYRANVVITSQQIYPQI